MPINSNLNRYDAILDERYGKPGTPERESSAGKRNAYCMGQEVASARKKEKMSQSDLASKVGRQDLYFQN